VPDRVTIVGDGAMGTLCALLLEANGHRVTLWGHDADYMAEVARTRENHRFLPGVRIPPPIDITGDDARVSKADLLVSAVPGQFVRRVWQRLSQHVRGNTPLCSITKGIEIETLLRPTQVVIDMIGPRPLAVLSGPCIAPEVAHQLPAAVVVASEEGRLARHIQQMFGTAWFRVYTNPDPIGVEIAGAAKNIIAIAAGIVDGLRLGSNCKAALLTRGIVEITRLGIALGAQRETFSGLAGIGDLVTTCISPIGRNRSAGEAIGRGKTAAQVQKETDSIIEGIPTTRSVIMLARRHKVEMPITHAAHRVLFDNVKPTDAIFELMTRQAKPEIAP
jgi:glycerol-3-phosphate dehydrogenase (NAD(P)+)